jgi:hypothetical protein
MNSDQNKSSLSQTTDRTAPGNGKLVGNKNLQGKGVQTPSSAQPAKTRGSDKDSAKDGKKS